MRVKIDLVLLEKQAQILRAISHPIRIAILDILQEKNELTVKEIHEKLQLAQAETSHHLAVLRNKGILTAKRSGKSVKYQLKIEKLSQIIQCINSCNIG